MINRKPRMSATAAGKLERRDFLKKATASSAAVAVVAASSFPKPALSKGLMKWRMGTTWPKNFPGLSTGANVLAEMIGKLSEGKLTVEVYGAGEIVPAYETMDAVSSGNLEMGHGAPYYWKGKVLASSSKARFRPAEGLGPNGWQPLPG